MKKYSLNDTIGRNVPLYKEILIEADSLDEALSAVNAVNYINSCETFKSLPDGIVYSMRALNEDGNIDYSGGWYVVLDRNNPLVQPLNN